ncbi:MAG TPA: hypothetical protein ENJ23_00325 [Bacteroidetes bacterium]|nr:hypothetical protein [Bacteroidota bacterium]
MMRSNSRQLFVAILAGWAVLFLSTQARPQQFAVSSEAPITADSLFLMQPRVSPDGFWIAAAGPNFAGIALLDSTGSLIRWLTRAEGAGYAFSWSEDGRYLLTRLYRTENRRRFAAAVLISVPDGRITQLSGWTRRLRPPRWTVAGECAYFEEADRLHVQWPRPVSARVQWERYLYARYPDRFFSLFLMLRQEREGVLLQDPRGVFSGRIPAVGGALLEGRFSPDGARLALEVAGRGLLLCDVKSGSVSALGRWEDVAWHPRGHLLAAVKSTSDGLVEHSAELFLLDVATGRSLQLTHTPDILEHHPGWFPDGKTLVCGDSRSGRLYRIRLVRQER